MKSHSSLTNLGLALGITHAMRHAAIFRAVVMLTLSCCRRSGEFKTQAELGQPIVRAIEDDHNQMGSYPASLADLTLKYLTTAPDIPDKRQHKFIGWDYCIITNRAAVSYSLRYCMGKGGVEYEPPDWFGNDEGNRKVVLSNRQYDSEAYPLIFSNSGVSNSDMLELLREKFSSGLVSVSTIPQSPGALIEELFSIFPQYRASYTGPSHDNIPTYHSVLIDFTDFFGSTSASLSPKQLKKFGTLINAAVAEDGDLENAFGTCLLEHLNQIKAERALRPYLSDLARKKTHA